MDEEKFTRETRSSHRRVEPEAQTKEKTYGSKLKNDTSRGEAMRKKLRTGKADTKAETLKEQKHRDKLRAQTKKKSAPKPVDAAVSARVHSQFAEANQDDNAGGDAVNAGTQAVESAIYSAKVKSHNKKSNGYGKKLHKKKHMEEKAQFEKGKEASLTSNAISKEIQKNRMKKEIQRNAINQSKKEAANGVASTSKRFVDKAEDMVGKLSEAVTEFLTKFVREHPYGCIIAVLVLMVVLVIVASLTSCGAGAGGVSNMTLSTSFTAQDETIIAVNDDYTGLETALQTQIDNIETTYPGYDEYNYNLNEISHNPFELAALLTVLYEDYTEAEVQGMLQTIMDSQYTLTTQRVVETRTRTVTRWYWVTRYRTVIQNGVAVQVPYQSYESYQVEEEYEYYILNVTLTNHSIDYVARNMGLTSEQLQRYEILLETFGNKKYLFEDDPYAAPNPGQYGDYRVPSEYLTDVEFGNMLHEAEKYLGYPYVWGGSNPSTSFDCSGFVSYVINNCGNGWNVGRQTANGLLNNCASVSRNNAKPGDLIFFQGTYDTAGASHVGIYVGDGMMIHCGNPIQYANINSSYWQSHFYTFGRLNH